MNTSGILTSLASWRGLALAFAFGLGAGGFATAKVQGAFHATEIAKIEKAQSAAAADQARRSLTEMVRLNDIIKGMDQDGYQALMASKAEADSLQLDLASGTRSLSARVTSCQRVVPSGSGMDDGTSIARLDEATSQSLAAIAADGDRAIIKMTGLQDYARLCEKALRSCPVSNTPKGEQ